MASSGDLGERQPLRGVVGGGRGGLKNGHGYDTASAQAPTLLGGDDDHERGAAAGGASERWFSFPRFSSMRRGGVMTLVVAACVAAVMVATAAVAQRRSAALELGQEASASITFKVYLCGLDDDVWREHVPWEVCRIKLVGCPTAGVVSPDCAHWFHDGIEMTPDDADVRKVFTVTTDKYKPGDEFGFAVVKAGCTVEEEEACAVDPTKCEDAELCDHRYDSGSAVDTGEETASTCGWSKNTQCSSKSPFANLTVEARTCLARREGAWLNRVVPATHEGTISAVWQGRGASLTAANVRPA